MVFSEINSMAHLLSLVLKLRASRDHRAWKERADCKQNVTMSEKVQDAEKQEYTPVSAWFFVDHVE